MITPSNYSAILGEITLFLTIECGLGAHWEWWDDEPELAHIICEVDGDVEEFGTIAVIPIIGEEGDGVMVAVNYPDDVVYSTWVDDLREDLMATDFGHQITWEENKFDS
ncbi:hypothetical protein QO230_00630 [Vibrio vulnificus]|uniref:hypothetical protein n=1 Tax=Vibrio vulnificus TaxID=672 RepID=UPI0024DFB013|nr:hypothetical protein [Vibrio vulnificus]MDK2606120.1 hypothetical protein [Vibrio vulnificus]MDK2609864.1 hypothetical protein [Vibrio vulnificus]MDK2627362.1 hypothetical protein [Vibrio vulnificus]MDK2702807.1 hypothetical protein [Vibrio vulnificus]